jgi:hypothetical protein
MTGIYGAAGGVEVGAIGAVARVQKLEVADQAVFVPWLANHLL